MASLKVFLILAFVQYVLTDSAAELNSLDPLIVQSVEVNIPNDAGLIIKYNNLNITGLESRELLGERIDTEKNSVWLKLKAKLHFVGDISITLTKSSKTLSGGYSLKIEVIEVIEYNYELKNDDKGVPYVNIINEKFTCEDFGEPKIEVSKDLEEAFKSQPLETAASEPKIEDLNNVRQHMLWKLLDVAFSSLVGTYRNIAKNIPATNFLESIKNIKNIP